MSAQTDLPLPPELAADAPLTAPVLANLYEAIVDLAGEAAIDVLAAAAMLAEPPDPEPGGQAPWRIGSLGEAEWAARHVAEATGELQALREQADDWQQRIAAWFEQASAKATARLGFFEAHLTGWALQRRAEQGVKSTQLPSAAVRTTEHHPRVTVTNEDQVATWADRVLPFEASDAVAPTSRRVLLQPLREHARIVEVIDRADLLLADGEVIRWTRPGLALDPVDAWLGARGGSQECPQVGDAWADEQLIARITVLQSHAEVRGPDGQPVPGVGIEAGRVTAKVTPT